jgi:hypothetical protein
MPEPPASSDLVEQVAATFHTVLRSWCYDLEGAVAAGARGIGYVDLEPWIEPTTDPVWIAASRHTVDIANTYWADLPADWRDRLLDVARAAGSSVIKAIEAGRSAGELDADDRFLKLVGEQLRRPWLAPQRVIVDGEVVRGPGMAEVALARTAVHVYAHRAAGFQGLGSVPRFPPPDLAQAVVTIDASGRGDEKSAAFRIAGESLDPAALTTLTGVQPDTSFKRGQFRMNRGTGLTYAVRERGCWLISSEGKLDRIGQSVEVHLRFLLDRLETHTSALSELITRLALDAAFWIPYHQRAFNSEWEISAQTLRRIGFLHASLVCDVYVETDEDDNE